MSVEITIDDVVKRYGDKTIIDKLSLDIKPGEFFTLLGPSGCGKTTLLRMIIGFNSIEGGEIRIDGEVVNGVPVNKRNMGMVFQNYAIFPHMSVKDNVAFGLKNKKLSKEEIESRLAEILKIVKIEDLKDRMPDQLSGGQQQRVALARAIVTHPKVLLMDEPLSNLDAKLRIEMRNAIKSIQQQMGITTVYVTHDQEEALAVSDRIAIMNKGVIQQIGTPREVYEKPANTFVSNFIGTSNILEADLEVKGDKRYLSFNNGYRENMEGLDEETQDRPVFVSIRPQDFIVATEGNGVKGIVKSSMFLGINTHYFIELSGGMEIEVTQDPDVSEIIPEGTEVYLRIKPQKVNLFDKERQYNLIKEGGQYGYQC
ncbi:MAG: ABC transporter ATP-binding protein [Tissierellaceae bacterium]